MAKQAGAYESWARTVNRTARTQPGRRAFQAKFEQQVDPEGTMSPTARMQAAEAARKAYYARLALMGIKARQAKRKS